MYLTGWRAWASRILGALASESRTQGSMGKGGGHPIWVWGWTAMLPPPTTVLSSHRPRGPTARTLPAATAAFIAVMNPTTSEGRAARGQKDNQDRQTLGPQCKENCNHNSQVHSWVQLGSRVPRMQILLRPKTLMRPTEFRTMLRAGAWCLCGS